VKNLLIKIGPLAVKAFVLDLKHDLLEDKPDKIRLDDKKKLFMEAIDNFCNEASYDEQESQLSDKV
jgi:ERCC4-related helicase